jgi:tripartite-type tricarboxylate transporter receptor subunit TctC
MAYVKSGSRSLNYASSGVGGTPHLTMEWLKSLAGLDIAHVPFNGGVGPAVNDLLGGHVDLMFANLSDISRHLEDGRIKALALAGAEPIADLPGIEPISNQFPGFFATTWFALAAPSATPHSILEKIASDVAVALAAPNVVERLRNLYLTPEGKSPQVSAAFVEADTERWHSVIEKIGLKPV